MYQVILTKDGKTVDQTSTVLATFTKREPAEQWKHSEGIETVFTEEGKRRLVVFDTVTGEVC